MTDWIGRTLSKVEIQRLLGRGGMAVVYLGRHTTLNRPVAVKILHAHFSDDATLLERFRAEAQSVAALRHPTIVQVFDFDVADDRPYIVMEYVDGLPLVDYLRRLHASGSRLAPEVVARLVAGVAGALDYAHARGIVHRDVKPANVLIRREAGPLDPSAPLPADVVPVLTDFGVARIAGSAVRTASGVISGTPAYMSPEQARGETVDARSDIYSLGVMLYEMLAGKLPFDSETPASLLIKHITEAPPPLPDASPELQAVVDRAMAKDREARYQRGSDLADGLRHALLLPSTGQPSTRVAAPIPVAAEATIADSVRPGPAPATIGATGVPAPAGATVPAQSPARPMPPGAGSWARRSMTCVGVAVLGLIVLVIVGALLNGRLRRQAGLQNKEYGLLGFRDGSALVDEVTLSVQGLPSPGDGKQYEAWLLGTEGEGRRSLGVLDQQSDGSAQLVFVGGDGHNLLSEFDRFEITVEPSPDSSTNPTGDVAYSGAIPPQALVHLRHLLVGFDRTPRGVGLSVGLLRQAEALNVHAKKMLAAQRSGDPAGVRRNAEAIFNAIVGRQGEFYGDLDGDGAVSDAGDGFGLLLNGENVGYIQGTLEHGRLSASAPDATENLRMHAGHAGVCIENLDQWAAQLRDLALRVAQSKDPAGVGDDVREMASLADRLLNGKDIDGNELVDPVRGEGGAITAYQHAQYMADIVVLKGADRVPAPAARGN